MLLRVQSACPLELSDEANMVARPVSFQRPPLTLRYQKRGLNETELSCGHCLQVEGNCN